MNEKLRLPAALAVIVLTGGCGESDPGMDAGEPEDAGEIADATPDAGCEPFEEYDPELMECIPLA